jgi:hypothetical protein
MADVVVIKNLRDDQGKTDTQLLLNPALNPDEELY